jgi:hypothetical protein
MASVKEQDRAVMLLQQVHKLQRGRLSRWECPAPQRCG